MRSRLLVLLALAVCLQGVSAAKAAPRGRSGKSGRSNAAMRQQEVAKLQKQLENARDQLDKLKNRASHSESEIAEARSRAISARQSIDQAAATHRESQKKLNEIEDRILDAQPDDSDFGKALTAFESAQHAVDVEMHRVLKWPPPPAGEKEADRLKELGTLSADQRAALKGDAKYAARLAELTEASERLTRIRSRLFSESAEWKRVHNEDVAAAKDRAEAERSRGGAANDRLEADRNLRNAADIAASLQQTIAQLEARLKALGGGSKSQKPGNSSGSGKGGK